MSETILDFCTGCGVLQPTGMGNRPPAEQCCANCGKNLAASSDRAQGTFSAEDAAVLLSTAFGE